MGAHDPGPGVDTAPSGRQTGRWAAAILLAAVAIVYGDLLLAGDGTIGTHRMGDGPRYFLHMRGFLAHEWAEGRVPLWNPHVFAGTPFAGVFQSAVFYPPNAIYLLLPLTTAFNLEIFGHALLLAGTTFLWLRGAGRSPEAALVAAAMATFGSTFALRVLAGQLSVMATIAWVPLLLWAIDRAARAPGVRPLLWAGLATTMMLLAGHPPTAFMAAMGVGLYAVIGLVRTQRRLAFAGGLAAMVAVSLLVAGVHLAAGFEIARQGTRHAGVSLDFATSFSLPPENLLTLLVPNLFGGGDAFVIDYAGRWWYWDDVAFFGVAGLALAALGLTARRRRASVVAAGFALLFGLLAMGGYTPLYAGLHRVVPGFDLLRAPSKFLFGTTLALAWLAAAGVDVLRGLGHEDTGARVDRRLAFALAAGAIAVIGFGLAAVSETGQGGATGGGLTPWLAALGPGMPDDPAVQVAWERWAGYGLQLSALTAAALAVLLLASRRKRGAVWLIVLLALVELGYFARTNRGGVPWDIDGAHRSRSVEIYRRPGDDRVLEVGEATSYGMSAGGQSVWGYDPVVLDRTTTFMAWTQGRSVEDLDNVGGEHPSAYHPALAMLRTRWVLDMLDSKREVTEHAGALPRFLLVGDAVVRPWPEGVLAALGEPGFDPRRAVVLETQPSPAPAGEPSRGRIERVAEHPGRIDLDVDLGSNAILLVTDAWAEGWRARSRDPASANRYELLPANGMLQAVPLAAGHHALRLEYAPAWVRVGWAATGVGLFVVAVACVFAWRERGGAPGRAQSPEASKSPEAS